VIRGNVHGVWKCVFGDGKRRGVGLVVWVCDEMEWEVIVIKHHRLYYWERWFSVEVASDVSIVEVSVDYQL
jgi:hypothetical protein